MAERKLMTNFCDNCGNPLQPTPQAPHKRFCGVAEGDTTAHCRNEYHARARQRLVDRAREAEAADETSPFEFNRKDPQS
jgi:hypothetical protein